MIRRHQPASLRRRRLGAVDPGVVERLAVALAAGDRDEIRAVLHPQVVLTIDSGGLVPGASTPLRGAAAASEALLALTTPDTSATMASINSVRGFLLVREDVVVAAVTAEVRTRLLATLWVVCNPEKLRHWNR
ncbi:hypothetical protein [Microbacterium sp. NPDC058345]|uniref:hypothetical protein n=1 Tax=Microbacterium sp. NPDC058345 TaxID=3346455 RepID=UPI00364B48DD